MTTHPTAALQLGYWLSSEEHGPRDLVRNAARAEEAGFELAAISDHYHPWVSQQGSSPFVWSVLGGIAHATEQIHLVTGVTAPIIRMHPAVVAHAAATTAAMMPGRFSLGLGTGERLNEHVTGAHWPRPPERREMLEEAIDIIRRLWSGKVTSHRGTHYTVEKAQLFTVPAPPPAVIVAGSSTRSARLAGRIGDGFFGVTPDPAHIDAFEGSGGSGKPRLGQVHVCWAESSEEALETATRWWPQAAIQGSVLTELAHPKDFEQVLSLARPEDVGSTLALGPDPQVHLDAIAQFATAGYSQVYVHQIGPDQEGFLRFYEREILPAVAHR
jgi:coenzyme F420-dependent glucose-6-phosphate dehydrogenase